jgi:DNA repair exonuclease SbcCD nuclease subunit
MDFFIRLSRKVKSVYILVGNHDLYYKQNEESNVNCRFFKFEPTEDKEIAPVRVINELSDIKIAGKRCLFVPWIDTKEQKEIVIDAFKNSYDLIFGHFDVVGNYGDHDNLDLALQTKDFGDNKLVMSGHYHKRKTVGPVIYVGSFISQTFNDVGDTKGSYKINTKNMEYEFVENDSPKFEYINIDDPKKFMTFVENASDEMLTKTKEMVAGNFIRLIMDEYGQYNDDVFDYFKTLDPLNLSVKYNRMTFNDDDSEFEGFDSNSDMIEVISSWVNNISDKLPDNVDPNEVISLIKEKQVRYKTLV